mmetsp:Transcript_27843/g.27718  ORF Transcript_27843/g.27718 Transcript_27843/m.27718 type:complete len:351 (-) Transcript_27843:245-1297(-)
MEPYLSEVIPPLLINLSDKKAKVNSSGNILLNLLIQRYGGDKLLDYFCDILDSKQASVVIGVALEVLSTQLIKATDSYFKDKLNIKKLVKRIGKMFYEFSSDRTITMPALGSLLALRDIEMSRTIKAIINLPSQQFEIVKDMSDSYAPDLSSDLNTTASDQTQMYSNPSTNYPKRDLKMNKFKSEDIEKAPLAGKALSYQHEMPKTTPYFHDYDKIQSNKEPAVRMSSLKESSSQGLDHKESDENDYEEELDNDQCIDCVSYYKRISTGIHSKQNMQKVTPKSKPYYVHILIDHYSDEETIYQIIDDLLDASDSSHNAAELLLIISNLIEKEEPPVLQALIKTEKYIISK